MRPRFCLRSAPPGIFAEYYERVPAVDSEWPPQLTPPALRILNDLSTPRFQCCARFPLSPSQVLNLRNGFSPAQVADDKAWVKKYMPFLALIAVLLCCSAGLVWCVMKAKAKRMQAERDEAEATMADMQAELEQAQQNLEHQRRQQEELQWQMRAAGDQKQQGGGEQQQQQCAIM